MNRNTLVKLAGAVLLEKEMMKQAAVNDMLMKYAINVKELKAAEALLKREAGRLLPSKAGSMFGQHTVGDVIAKNTTDLEQALFAIRELGATPNADRSMLAMMRREVGRRSRAMRKKLLDRTSKEVTREMLDGYGHNSSTGGFSSIFREAAGNPEKVVTTNFGRTRAYR